MDLRRQVALGAVFGAAVAVNAALQSLQDAGSFLIRKPYSESTGLPSFMGTRSVKRGLSSRPDSREASYLRAFLDDELDDDSADEGSDEEGQLLDLLSASSPTIDTSASFTDTLTDFEADSPTTYHAQKLPVKRKSAEVSSVDEAECYLKASDEENSSVEDSIPEWEDASSSKSKRKSRGSLPISILPPMCQSEEAMSAMLQQTTNTVLETLSEAKERREQMLEEMQRINLPEEQTSLQLVNRFIEALINVSDSLQVVHSALF